MRYVCTLCHGDGKTQTECPSCGQLVHVFYTEVSTISTDLVPACSSSGPGPFYEPCEFCVKRGRPPFIEV